MTFISKDNLKNDLLGGISAGIVTLPVALAYGVTTGLGPMAGMYTAVILGFLAVIFGGTNTQISSPTGAMTVVVALIIAQEIAIAGSIGMAIPVLIATFALTGLMQMLLGLFKLGMNIRYVPFTVVSGFMSGIGIIIIAFQIDDVFGVTNSPFATVPEILWNIKYFIMNVHWESFAMAISTLLIIYLFPLINKRIPGSLVALVIVSLVAHWLFDIDKPDERENVQIVILDYMNTSYLAQIFQPGALIRIGLGAISLALLGSINTLLTSMVADKMTQSVHDSNKELVGQGLGNFVAGLFGGFPGGGATACTVANIQAGGRNKISGIVSSSFLLVILLFGTTITDNIPHAVLGGVLIHIGIVLIDNDTLKRMKKIPKADNLVMLTVLTLTVFWNLLYAVSIGLVFASLYFMKKMADVVEVDTEKSKVDKIIDQVIDSFTDSQGFERRVLIKSIKGPVFFGFSSRFLISMRNIPNDIEAVIFNMSQVPYMDHSGVRTFIEVVHFLNEKGTNICFSEVSESNMRLLRGFDLIPQLVDEQHIFDSVEECILWLNEPGHIENKFGDESTLYFPSAFTPNGDGINDDWKIKNIHQYPQAEVKIFSNKEDLVFESVGYTEPWNGQFKGELLSPGEYKYFVKLDDQQHKKGSVFIFR